MKEYAKEYADLGYSVIPLAPQSKTPPPGFYWDRFKTKRARPESVGEYFEMNVESNVGIVCGRISNLVVVDVDAHGADPSLFLEHFPDVPTVVTGSGGLHLYFAHAPIKTMIGLSVQEVLPGVFQEDCPITVDFKSDASYVVAPPSIHPETRKEYVWHPNSQLLPSSTELPRFPHKLLNLSRMDREARTEEDWGTIISSTKEGNRNDNLVALMGLLLHQLPKHYWKPVVAPMIKLWNDNLVKPPMDSKQLKRTWDALVKKESKKYDV